MESIELKNELGETVWQNTFGVKTYLPTKKELKELGFSCDDLFINELKVLSSTGSLEFRITNSGTHWKAYLTVKNGMFSKTETCWVIHPQSSDDVRAIVRSFTGQFANRDNGIF
jgi:hypothetical protein